MNNFGIIIAIVVVGFVVVIGYFASQNKSVVIEITDTSEQILTIDADDHVQGNVDAQVVMFEYSDFECPACGGYHPVVKEVLAQYGDNVAYVSRHFPLYFHQNSRTAAYAVEAAAVQDKYAEMADLVFINQGDWASKPTSLDLFDQYAVELGLDIEQWKKDAESETVKRIVETDLAEGKVLGVNSTPSFFIGGKKITNPGGDSVENIAQAFIEIIKSAESTTVVGDQTATTTQ